MTRRVSDQGLAIIVRGLRWRSRDDAEDPFWAWVQWLVHDARELVHEVDAMRLGIARLKAQENLPANVSEIIDGLPDEVVGDPVTTIALRGNQS